MSKLNLGLVFGGQSQEHEISVLSASSVYNVIDRKKYDIFPAAISKTGKWLSVSESRRVLEEEMEEVPESAEKRLDSIYNYFKQCPDVIFPLLHGPFGEDGRLQGMLEMFDIPYVGCGVLSSALAMDKAVSKRVFSSCGLPQADYLIVNKYELKNGVSQIEDIVKDKIGLPCFIKPANMGSSIGISRLKDFKDFESALNKAFEFDKKVVIEEEIKGREIECSVLGNEKIEVSLPGEIIPSAEYYDYDSKYNDEETELVFPVSLSEELINKVQNLAIKVFKAVDGSGLARIDFFLRDADNKFVINEVNTIPGFTRYSMYPKLWEVSGLDYDKLVDKLIKLTLEE